MPCWEDICPGEVRRESCRAGDPCLGRRLADGGELLSRVDVGRVGMGLFTTAVDPMGLRGPLLKTIGPEEAIL
jgi:hypothetical protein